MSRDDEMRLQGVLLLRALPSFVEKPWPGCDGKRQSGSVERTSKEHPTGVGDARDRLIFKWQWHAQLYCR